MKIFSVAQYNISLMSTVESHHTLHIILISAQSKEMVVHKQGYQYSQSAVTLSLPPAAIYIMVLNV